MIRSTLYLLILWGLLGCASDVKTHGPGNHSIRCEKAVARCHEQARNLCPDGYIVTNRARPHRNRYGTQFILNVRCRMGNMGT